MADADFIRHWAKSYIRGLHWALAPVWLDTGHGCGCPKGEDCATPGRHLVSGAGVAHEEDDVDKVWCDDTKLCGIAVLTGSESHTIAVDVRRDAPLAKARLSMHQFVLTQRSPSGGEHWFFRLGEDETVRGGPTEIDLVSGIRVMGEGDFVVIGPREGYSWVGGAQVLVRHMTSMPEPLRLVLAAKDVVPLPDNTWQDAPWRTRPGVPLVSSTSRSYTKQGDIRRLIDQHGDRVLFTPSLGWRMWTESGWQGEERAKTELRKAVLDLPVQHREEADQHRVRGKDTVAKDALKWAKRCEQRSAAAVFSDLDTDVRVLTPDESYWDAQDYLIGLPVDDGVGRVIDLRSGKILPDEQNQQTLRISRQVGVPYNGEPWSEMWLQSHWFHKYLHDLTAANGPEWVRLLQRAAGASLYGRRGGGQVGNTDAIVLLKGPTRCGKSTFVEALLAATGDYGAPLDENLLFGDRGNPEFAVASLFGVRVLTGSEPPDTERRPLNTTMLKKVTGGDSLTGRLPYGRSSITFKSEAMLWLSANHSLDISDDAVWRRMYIFDFAPSLDFTGARDEPQLRGALSSDPIEKRAMLAWALEGARDFAEEGWGDTSLLTAARDEDRARIDPLSEFISGQVHHTGLSGNTFTEADLATAFDRWRVFGADGKVGPFHKHRDEVVHRIVRSGIAHDREGKLFVGGILKS